MKKIVERKTAVSSIVALLWLATVIAVGFQTLRSVAGDDTRRTSGAAWQSATNLVESVRADLLGHLWHKDEFLDANGGLARMLGHRRCNEVIRLLNGHLSKPTLMEETAPYAATVDELSVFCSRNGCRALFVLFPYKVDPDQSVVPRGAPFDYANQNADGMLHALRETELLDLRPLLASSPEDVTRHFFRTDHHWNFHAAFAAFPVIVRRVLALMGEPDAGIAALEASQWKQETFPRRFLGTFGRRTGPWFGGTESIEYYVPAFQTDLLCSVRNGNWTSVKIGPFEQSVVWTNVLAAPSSHYADLGYSIYGSDRPLIRFHNRLASVKRTLLVAKDSYATPVCAFLATVFSDVVVVDLRHWQSSPLPACIRAFKPDVVAVMYNSRSFAFELFFDFGVSESGLRGEETDVLRAGDVAVGPDPHPYKHVSVGTGWIHPGDTVALTVGAAETVAGDSTWATVSLYDAKTGETLVRDGVALGAATPQTILFSVPDRDGDYRILLYAGEAGKANGQAVEFKDVLLERVSRQARRGVRRDGRSRRRRQS